jgi:haloalkane dehalogenase
MGQGARPAWCPDDLYPFEDHYLEVDGNRVHYVDEGSGPPLLLLHGQPTWSFLYRHIVLALRDRFRCVAPDYPGFGLSTPRPGYGFTPAEHAVVVERLVLELDLTDGAVMVQDWGGPIGLWVAGRHADRFRGLVIGNTWAWPVDDDRSKTWFSKILGGPAGGILTKRLAFFERVFLERGMRKKRLSARERRAYTGRFPTPRSREPQIVFPRSITAARDFLVEVESGLPGLRDRPTLIVWGDRDVAFRKRDLTRFQELFPRHRTVMLHGAGHYIQEDAPEEITAAIRTWWDQEVSEPARR